MWILTALKDALRYWRRRPILALTGLLLLTLGTGVLHVIWAMTDTIVLKPLAYPKPENLYGLESVEVKTQKRVQAVAIADLLDITKNQTQFDAVMGYRGDFLNFREDDGSTTQIFGSLVTSEFNKVYGLIPELGSLFTDEHFIAGQHHVVIISYGLWESEFSKDAGVIGKTMQFDDDLCEVIGVMPKSFKEPAFAEAWRPFPNGSPEGFGRDSRYWSAVVRVKEGVTESQALGELQSLAKRFEEQYPTTNSGWSLTMKPLQEIKVGNLKTPLYLLMAAVSLVLLTTCINLANLQMMSGLQRISEMGIRMAIGESARRLFVRVFVESFVLCVGGSLLGLAVGFVAVKMAANKFSPLLLPRINELTISSDSLWISVLLIVVMSILFGLLPALLALRTQPGTAIKASGSRSGSGSGGAKKTRSMLMVTQIAVTLIIVHAAAFTWLGVQKLRELPLGLDIDNKMVFMIAPKGQQVNNLDKMSQYYYELEQRLAEIQGIRKVSSASSMPMLGGGMEMGFNLLGRDLTSERGIPPTAVYNSISNTFLDTLGVKTIQGEGFSDRDGRGTAAVAMVNQAFVEAYLPDTDPIGQEVQIMQWMEPGFRRIVGVIKDYKETSPTADPKPMVLVPASQTPWIFTTFVIEYEEGAAGVVRKLQQEMSRFDPDVGITTFTVEELLEGQLSQMNIMSMLLVVFAVFVGGLSVFGIGSQVAFMTQERMQEWGIRMALGAEPQQLKQLMVILMLKLVAFGIVVGGVGLAFLYPMLRQQVVNMPTWDAVVSVLFVISIGVITAIVSWLLSWRVGKAQPTMLLQSF